jgi:phosphoenolpyruvate---glycerone phosphotransferase subunit DhaL
MSETLTRDDVVAIVRQMASDLDAAAGRLNELDAATGDGDLGMTMTLGFRSVLKALDGAADLDVGAMATKLGMAFNSGQSSSMAVLLATAAMRAGREVRGATEITVADLARMLQAATTGIQERGKAQLGDKSMVDAMVPASEALARAAEDGRSLNEALALSLAAAEEGVRATIPLRAKIGRASWIAERSAGHQDAGATAFSLMLKTVVDYVAARGNT